MKISTILCCLLLTGSIALGQSTERAAEPSVEGIRAKQKGMFLSLGFALTDHQDQKYSDVVSTGPGLALGIGWQNIHDKRIIQAGLDLSGSFEVQKTHEEGSALVVFIGTDFGYQTRIAERDNSMMYLGGRMSAGGFFRKTSGLGNNSINVINRLYFAPKFTYYRQINDRMGLSLGTSIGLFGWQKELGSFAFSAPQEGLENGDFNYQDGVIENPLAGLYFSTIGEFNDIDTHVALHLGKRWRFGYDWNMLTHRAIKKRPIVVGRHRLTATIIF